MITTASVWLVYRLSASPFAVALIYFANQAPVIFSPFAGVWIDRVDGLKLARLTQFLGMLQSGALAVFTFGGWMTVPTLFWLSLLQGLINALDFPVRQTLTIQLAGDREHLDNAIVLNSLTFNVSRMVGPAIAGFIIALWGGGICFTIDAVSYLGVLGALLWVKLPPRAERKVVPHPLHDLMDGIRYAWKHPAIRRILTLVPIIAFVGFAHTILAPTFAKDVYHGDSRIFGFLNSATGIGSVIAGGYLSLRRSPKGLVTIIARGAVIGGVGLILAGLFHPVWCGLITFALAGAGGALVMVGGNTLLQTSVDDEKRGRVISLFTTGQACFPLGGLVIGRAAELATPSIAIAACGVLTIVAAIWYGGGISRIGKGAPGEEGALG